MSVITTPRSRLKIHSADSFCIPKDGLYILSGDDDKLLICGDNPLYNEVTNIYFVRKDDIYSSPDKYYLEYTRDEK
ncbi:MAG: hypothetical protein E7276_01540 [Pseudobutyrivibrio sp.]|nr:hypothetical protein [Pseudobutyrivibrio sp.]